MFFEWLVLSELMDDDDDNEERNDDGEKMLLGHLFDLDEIDPINFTCERCSHSFEDHENTECDYGVFRKCDCPNFILSKKQLAQAKDELMKIEGRLLKNYKKAKELHDHS